MGHLIGRSRCPECAKKGADKRGDNLATYSDGHSFCYSCGYVRGDVSIKLSADKYKIAEIDVEMPGDALPFYNETALNWFLSYGFNYTDLIKNNILYSEKRKLLIFPYINENNELFAWQGRYFGEEPSHPKWWNRGSFRKYLYVANLTGDNIILVEDVVSMLKLSKFNFPVGCLFGSSPSTELINKYAVKAKQLTWWLDHDKRIEAVKYKRICESLGIQSKVVFTIDDPKELSYEQIRSVLNV